MKNETIYQCATGSETFPASDRLAAFRAKTGCDKAAATYKLIRDDGSDYRSKAASDRTPSQLFTRYGSISAALVAKKAAEANGEPMLIVDLA